MGPTMTAHGLCGDFVEDLVVQMNGLECSFQSASQDRMSRSRAWTGRWTPRLS
jgi:hypothetical protein